MALPYVEISETQASGHSPGSVGDNIDPSRAYMEQMKSERNRLETFWNWSPAISQRPGNLAKSGLFYTNISDRVQCPFCYGVLKKWLPFDDPFTEHSKHFPHCRFIRGLDVGNIPIEWNDSMNVVPVYSLRHNVYQYPAYGAVNIAPPYATNIVTYRETSGPTVHVVQPLKQEHVDLTKEVNRLKTYSRWPSNLNQPPEELARAGFYAFPGDVKLDRVKCAYCKGKLFSWKPDDEPWLEHARCFPRCPYIKLCLGAETVKKIQQTSTEKSIQSSVHNEERPSTFPPPPEPPPGLRTATSTSENEDNLNLRMASQPVEAILAMGFQQDLVRRTVRKCLRERPGHFPSAEELASMVMELEDPATAAPTAAPPPTPLRRIKTPVATGKIGSDQYSNGCIDKTGRNIANERFLCKICMENRVRVTFMPCGHLACCGPCSLALSECPICRTHITKCIRTYF